MSIKDWGFSKKRGSEWPLDSTGKLVKPTYLTNIFPTNMELEIIVGLFESSGIPIVTKHPGDGSFGKIILGMSGTGTDLYVPETNLAEAKELLKGYKEEENEQQIQD